MIDLRLNVGLRVDFSIAKTDIVKKFVGPAADECVAPVAWVWHIIDWSLITYFFHAIF